MTTSPIVDRAAPGRAIRDALLAYITEYQMIGLPAELPADTVASLRQAAELAAAVAGVPRDEATLAMAGAEFLERLQLWLDQDEQDQAAEIVAHARELLTREFTATTRH